MNKDSDSDSYAPVEKDDSSVDPEILEYKAIYILRKNPLLKVISPPLCSAEVAGSDSTVTWFGHPAIANFRFGVGSGVVIGGSGSDRGAAIMKDDVVVELETGTSPPQRVETEPFR